MPSSVAIAFAVIFGVSFINSIILICVSWKIITLYYTYSLLSGKVPFLIDWSTQKQALANGELNQTNNR